jgi:hypothetical protein
MAKDRHVADWKVKGTAGCEITMRSGPLIHQDHEPSIRVDEDQEFNCLREDEES